MKKKLVIETDKGVIEINFLHDLAPEHCKRITTLANEGFYNGLNFHRVIDGFVAQGGCPHGNGTGGSGENIKAEFNKESHQKGVVSMARANDPNSADSQFFICLDDCSFLDGHYTVWGKVSKGMNVVKKIEMGEPPEKPTIMKKVYVK